MAIAAPWVGNPVQGNVTGSNVLTITADVSGATNGEVCFIMGTMGDAQTGVLATPAGWTKLDEMSEGTSGGSSSRSVVYWKVKTSGDTTVTITGGGWTFATRPQFVGISWAGVDTTAPTEQFTWGAAHISGTSYVSGTATPTAADRWAVGLFTARGTTALVTWTPPAAMTERVDVINATGFFVALTIADSNGAVTQASHSYTATGQSASHGLGALFYLIPASGSITGTVAATQADNTSSASGQLGYSGTVASAQAANTAAASGTLGYSGTVSVTQANQTASASGKLGYTGTVSVTQAANTAVASGTFTTGFSGSIAVTQANQTAVAAGKLGYSGSAAVTQASNTAVATGKLGYSGAVAVSQGANTAAIQGVALPPISGAIAVTQANQVAVISGNIATLVFPGTAHAATGAAASASPGSTSTPSATAAVMTSPTATGG